jgi:hypothetical protein
MKRYAFVRTLLMFTASALPGSFDSATPRYPSDRSGTPSARREPVGACPRNWSPIGKDVLQRHIVACKPCAVCSHFTFQAAVSDTELRGSTGI